MGRILQTDPVGYEDQVNLYAYVGNDPVNMVDPTGMEGCLDDLGDICVEGQEEVENPAEELVEEIVVVGERLLEPLSAIDNFDLASFAYDSYCSLPALGISGSARGYDVLGGGILWNFAFDPQSGRIGATYGVDVGAGYGGEVKLNYGFNATAGGAVPDGWSAAVVTNANARIGPLAAGASYTLVGTNGSGPGAVSAGFRPGGGGTINVNLGARGDYGGRILPPCPKR